MPREPVPVINAAGLSPQLRTVLAQLGSRLRALYGQRLVKLILYGSQARGDARPGSDVDILVVLQGSVHALEEIERTDEILTDVSVELNQTVTCLFIEEERFLNRNGPLLRNIRREGVPL